MMLELALTLSRSTATTPRKVQLVETTADEYYGKGYQDVQNRVPKIDNTCADLDWKPKVAMDEALTRIFDAYRGQVAEARHLRRLTRAADRCSSRSRSTSTRCAARAKACRAWSSSCASTASSATFLFSLGPDHTGRAIKRVFRPGFFGKVRRTSVRQALRREDAALRHAAARPRHRPPRRAT